MNSGHDAVEEHVILLHGLCRTSKSLRPLAETLTAAGYRVHNIDYPSRRLAISELSEQYVTRAILQCQNEGATMIHFVTHSMGGILVRDYLSRHTVSGLGKVVMLAPPNQGSEVVDCLRKSPLFRWLNGPAGQELGTGPASAPNRLGEVRYPVGIIAGDRSINWINSLMISGPNDGKVSVERTKVLGMSGHLVVHVTHPFIMRNKRVLDQVLVFLETGQFRS